MTSQTTRATLIGLALVLFSGSCGVASAQTPGESEQTAAAAPAANRPDRGRITWTFSERVRYSGLFNQFRPGLSGNDQAMVFRTALKAEFVWPHLTLGGEVQDARAYLTDSESNVSTALVNAVDLLQAYVQVGGADAARSRVPEAQIGRFSMELGSGRLIAQEAYRDVTRTFTGGKVRWRPGRGAAVTAFAVLPVLTMPEHRDDLLHNRIEFDRQYFNQKFWGALYEQGGLWLHTLGELYVNNLREHDASGRETRDRQLWTAGLRLYRLPSARAWDMDFESAWQRGTAHATNAPSDPRSLDVSARLLHVHAGYTSAGRWSPRVGLEYDYGSGDADPTDAQWNRFDGLFGNRRVELGPTSIYGALGRENISTLGLRVSLATSARVDAFAVYRVLRLAAAADVFASSGVRDSSGRSGRDAGRQLDLRLRAWIVPDVLRLEAGATHLAAGSFFRLAPNATREGDTTFFYSEITYSLGSKRHDPIQAARP